MTDRHGLGGNSPPASALFLMHIEDLLASANSVTTIETDEQEAVVDDLLKQLRTARKDADAKRTEEKRSHMEAAKAVDDEWREPVRKADIGADGLKARLTPYRTAKQRAKDEAATALRAEADARQKAAQDALRSDDLEQRYQAETELKVAGKMAATANRIARAPTGLRTHWLADVERPETLLRWIQDNDPDALRNWLNDYARSAVNRGVRSLAGTRIFDEQRAA